MQVKPGYKQTEVGVIPKDWLVQSLETLTERIMVGIASAATHAYRDRGIVMFRNQNIKSGHLDDSDILYIAEDYEVLFRNKRLKGGDLLIARTGYPGTASIVPAHYEGAQSFTTLIARSRPELVDNVYLCHYINSERGRAFFERSQIGGGQKNVNAGTLKNLPVPLPTSKAEQTVIAQALSDADAFIESLEHLLNKKRAIKQGAMQELLKGERRLPGFSSEWLKLPLKQLGLWCGGGTPSMRRSEFWDGGTIPWASSADVRIGPVTSTISKITERGLKESSTNLIPSGAILIVTRSGILRRFLPVGLSVGPLAINQDIKALVPSPDVISEFLFYALVASSTEILSSCMKSGTTVESIELTWLKQFEISLPRDPQEQFAIAATLFDIDSEIDALQAKLGKARALKEGMLQELLTGRVRLI